tara:strand:- start:9480 stop:11720 length:2241 start_codon:yes stop_codon:yes gene_type:complete
MSEKLEESWDWKSEIENNEYMNPVQRGIIKKLHDPSYEKFHLDPAVVNTYTKLKAPFGFDGLGELVYMRTYSRIKEDGSNEQWHDTVERVVNGTYNLQKRHILENGLRWNDYKAQQSAKEMYGRMFDMKFLPPGRGLWAMGSEITEERGLYAALNNCGFTSTENILKELSLPFRFLMDMSMLGVGVGFDTYGAGKITIEGVDERRPKEKFVIPDTREGWVESVGRQIDSYFLRIGRIEFDYSNLREEGKLINGFGGKSSGAAPLKLLHKSIDEVLSERIGKPIDSRTIVDLQNLIGQCVVAGNVRRTAEIALGAERDEEFLDLKNYSLNPERKEFGWTSNNSIDATLGMDYGPVSDRIMINGEPGLIWMQNAREFGRMMDPKDNKDRDAKGVNPCVEQTLHDKELCTLVETFPVNHDNLEDFKRTLKFAYLYAKTVTLGRTHIEETNRVMLQNRRIGCSMSGIQQFVAKNGINDLIEWSKEGYEVIQNYDDIYSKWMAVRPSIKTTSIKPSGTVSLLAGATPGMHWPISRYALRRVRVSKGSDLIAPLKEAGYKIREAYDDKSSCIVESPMDFGDGIRGESEVPIREQFEMAATLQNYWADNQVSCTIKFKPDLKDTEIDELIKLKKKVKRNGKISQKNFEKNLERIIKLETKAAISETQNIKTALNDFQYRLKGISMLPFDDRVYLQPPFERIDKETYLEMVNELKPINFEGIGNQVNEGERGCSNDVCEIEIWESGKDEDPEIN